METLKEKLGGGKPTYQQEQAKQRTEEREKHQKKLVRKKFIRDKKATQKQKLEDTFSMLPTKIKEIHLDGITITKDALVENILSDLLKAKNYGEVMSFTKDAQTKLQKLGCFKRVDGYIDTSNDPTGLIVTFKVKECGPLYGNVKFETSDNEGNLHIFGGIKNFAGHSESLECSHLMGSLGTRKTEVRYLIPLMHYLEKTTTNRAAYFIATVFDHRQKQTWSSLQFDDVGFKIGGLFQPFSWLKQSIQWRASWRQLQPLTTNNKTNFKDMNASTTSQVKFDAREVCGHTLKSSLIHKLSFDTRDDRVMPTTGIQASLVQELAGLSPIGTTAFFKSMCSIDISKRLKEYLSVSFSAAAGLVSPMKALDGRDVSLMPPDRFLLGGPLILRGFAPKSIEYSESNRLKNIPDKKLGKTDACYLGGRAFWRACAQLYFPMPYLRRKNTWVADNMKGHAFLECGSLGNPISRSVIKAFGEEWTCLQNIRASCGVGLVLRLGEFGRAELNYCLPLRCKNGDRVQHGLQFGIGAEFS